jgi:hypothetical protein
VAFHTVTQRNESRRGAHNGKIMATGNMKMIVQF